MKRINIIISFFIVFAFVTAVFSCKTQETTTTNTTVKSDVDSSKTNSGYRPISTKPGPRPVPKPKPKQ